MQQFSWMVRKASGGGGAYTNVNSVKLLTDEYIDCGNVPVWTNMSVFAWVKMGSATAGLAIVSKWEASDNERSLVLQSQDVNAARIQILLSGNGTTVQKNYRGSQTALSTSGWNHVGFTFAGGTDSLLLYVNGVVDAAVTKVSDTALGGTIFSSAAKLMLGCISKNGAGSSSAFLDGYLDNVDIFGVALSGAEVTELYNAGKPMNALTHSQASNLKNRWPIGEGSDSNTFFDDVAGSNDGTGVNIESGDIQTDIP